MRIKNALIAGVDEVGRGPLAGPVLAAAVILDPAHPIKGLKDSKQLSPLRRKSLAILIQTHALTYAIGRAEVEEIDHINILQASLLAMSRALERLKVAPDEVWVDGIFYPKTIYPTQAFIKGDQRFPMISAASIIAKVARDREMVEWDRCYPEYGFAVHKGYPTAQHREALRQHGPCPLHRRSFRCFPEAGP